MMNSLQLSPQLAAKELLARRTARNSLGEWCVRNGFEPAVHHRLLISHLERVERGDCKRLIICLPPGSAKSTYASVLFPAWYTGRNSEKAIIAASHTAQLAERFSRKVRNLISDSPFRAVFGYGLSADSTSVQSWETERGGEYFAVGVGGSVTGRRGDLVIIDDPVKSREEADSETIREKVWDWYVADLQTRLKPHGAIVVILTRWHEDDLAGRLLKQAEEGGEQWEVVSVPMIAGEGDLLGRKPGERLWPEWFTDDMVSVAQQDARNWSALYQQEPRPSGGGEFRREWVEFYEGSPDDVAGSTNKYILVDPASEKRKNNDYTSIWCVGLGQDGNYYVLDMVRDRLNLTERAAMVMQMHRRWKPMQVRYERYGMMADIQYLRELQGRENYRFAIEEVAGQTPKNDRIRRLIPLFEQRKVWFPQSMHRTDHTGKVCELVDAFIHQELLAFPVGVHDDMLDALARIAEPDMPLTWPQQQIEDKYQSAAYRRGGRVSAWAA